MRSGGSCRASWGEFSSQPSERASPQNPTPRSGCQRHGTVLVVVTIVLVLISLSAYGFVARMQNANEISRLTADRAQAENLVESGIEFLHALIESPRAMRFEMGGMVDNPKLFCGQIVSEQTGHVRRGRFFIVSPQRDENSTLGIRFGVQNESSKIHLGRLLEWDRQQPGSARAALMHLPAMTAAIADAILDWIDQDNLPREFGAEADYYAALARPYRPTNTLPRVLEELLAVKDVTRDRLLGADLNHDYRTHPVESAVADDATSTGVRTIGPNDRLSVWPWSDYLTLHSGERNEDQEGRRRINLNHPDLFVLHSELMFSLGQAQADFIIAYRQFGPYEAAEPNDSGTSYQVDLSREAKYQLASPLQLIGAMVNVSVSADDTVVLRSPFVRQPDVMHGYLPLLCDRTTTDDRNVVPGRININSASSIVLGALPWTDDAIVERILAARTTTASSTSNRDRSPVWLFLDGIVDLPTMTEMLPHLTTGGDVIRAQVIGCFGDQSPWARVVVTLDGGQRPSRTLVRTSLANLGRGFSISQLAQRMAGSDTTRTKTTSYSFPAENRFSRQMAGSAK